MADDTNATAPAAPVAPTPTTAPAAPTGMQLPSAGFPFQQIRQVPWKNHRCGKPMVPVLVVQAGRPDSEGVQAWNCGFCKETEDVSEGGETQWQAVQAERRMSPPVIRVPAPKVEPAPPAEPEQDVAAPAKPAKPVPKIPQNVDDVRAMIVSDPGMQKSAVALAAMIRDIVPEAEPGTQPAQWTCPTCKAQNALSGPVAGVQSVTCVCGAEVEISVVAREPAPQPMALLCQPCGNYSFDVARVDLPTADNPDVTARCPNCDAAHGLSFADGQISWKPPAIGA